MVLVSYENRSESPVSLSIGGAPGDPPAEYYVEPGARCEGPAGYEKVFARHGLVRVADDAPPPRTGAFDPVTGLTDKQAAAGMTAPPPDETTVSLPVVVGDEVVEIPEVESAPADGEDFADDPPNGPRTLGSLPTQRKPKRGGK